MKCPKCGADVLACVSLRGNPQLLDAKPSYGRGNYLIAAANGLAGAGTRMAIHLSHFDSDIRKYAESSGLRLYRAHFATCPEGVRAKAKVP